MNLKKFLTQYLAFIILIFLSFFAIRPLLQSGFFPIHDDTQVIRVQQMTEALRDNQFPVRWVDDLGYGFGYPIFNFYAPLAYYIGAIFNLVGFNALVATKIMFSLGIILAGLSMYFLGREFWGKTGGLIAGLFYVYAPYHALDVYVRGAVSEFWAMVFLPLVFLGIYRIYRHQRGVFIGVIGLTGVILSHNLTAMMASPFILLVTLFLFSNTKSKKLFLFQYSKFIILALVLSAFYWLPALVEMSETKVFSQIGGSADWPDHFVYLDQLWASPWGFAGSAAGRLDGMSFMIGKIHLLVTSLTLIILIFRKKLRPILLFSLGFLLIAVFLTNSSSSFIWQAIPVMAFIQYPWRFLVFTTLATSFMAGSIVLWLPKYGKFLAIGFILILLVFNAKYFQPQKYLPFSATDYINEENIKWQTSKISDEYLPRDFPIPQIKEKIAWEKIIVNQGQAEIEEVIIKSHRLDFNVLAQEQAEILVNTAYFPGWRVWVDGQSIDPKINAGKISLSLPAGQHSIKLRFTNTIIRVAANLISLIGAGMLIFLVKQ